MTRLKKELITFLKDHNQLSDSEFVSVLEEEDDTSNRPSKRLSTPWFQAGSSKRPTEVLATRVSDDDVSATSEEGRMTRTSLVMINPMMDQNRNDIKIENKFTKTSIENLL